jgi:hypothetical protein
MSKLDEIIAEYSGRMRPRAFNEAIKALMLELIGDDVDPDKASFGSEDWCQNKLRRKLRADVEEL